jgi:hypothetical protein
MSESLVDKLMLNESWLLNESLSSVLSSELATGARPPRCKSPPKELSSELAPSTQSLLSERPPSLLSSELSTSLLSKPLLNVLLSELLSSTRCWC